MIVRHAQSWQLILADLALILFLVTLSALAVEEGHDGEAPEAEAPEAETPQIAAAQALFRLDPRGPSLSQWLAERPADGRATLTVFARFAASERAQIWRDAEALASEASESGFAVRVVLSRADSSDIYASLAYDAPIIDPETEL
jgi:hypothetical protein